MRYNVGITIRGKEKTMYNNRLKLEKQTNRIFNLAFIGSVFSIILSLGLILALAYGCYELVSYVLDHGLKGLVNIIWNGAN